MKTPVEAKELSDLFGTPEDGNTGFYFGGRSGDALFNGNQRTGYYLGGPLGCNLMNPQGVQIALLSNPLKTQFFTLDGRGTDYVLGGITGKDVFYLPPTG